MTTNEKEPELPPIDEQAQTAIDAVIAANTMQAVFENEAVMVELLKGKYVHWLAVPDRYREAFNNMFRFLPEHISQSDFHTFYNSLI
jgi:hypothetical protein